MLRSNFWWRSDKPTKCIEIIYFFIFFYDGSYMFRQNIAILRDGKI
jgi:hypothetical protein